MCGIAGIVMRDAGAPGAAPVDTAALRRMTDALSHRGPDGEGFFEAEGIGLGHRRLSVVDLEGGAQPMSSPGAGRTIVFNGEIYNQEALRKQLESRGHRFRTRSDTEVLLAGYAEWGEGVVVRVRGMFAFAIYDASDRSVLLARDAMGEKPLYYAHLASGELIFASELSALLAHPRISSKVSAQALASYLSLEYVPGDLSIIDGVRKLRPGHIMRVRHGQLARRAYFELPIGGGRTRGAEAVERFRALFDCAVERCLMSDVPLGVFLSGGIDSSSVAASAARLRGAAGLHTFSIGFDDPSFDESAAARAVAATLRSTHHERIFGVTELIDRIRHVALAMDEPLGDPSMLPTHLLSEFAREHVTVALGGDGGDELLCGYATFRAERVARLYAQLPAFARRGVAAAVRRLPVSHGYMSLDFVAKRFVDGAAIPAERRHLTWLSSVVPGSADDPLHPELRERWGADEIFEEAESSYLDPVTGDDLERLSRQYSLNYLPGDILVKTDRASMANSLEVRSPFLDRDLVEFVAALPSQERISWLGGPKRILKRSMRGRIPDWVMRRRKQGFGLPIGRWLRGPLIPLCDELLAVERLRAGGHFEPVVVHRLLAEHRSGSHEHRKVLWTLLAFELWRDRHGLSG